MATHVIPKAIHRNRSQSHQDKTTTGQSRPRWLFPRRDTSNSDRGITVRSSREPQRAMVSASSQKLSQAEKMRFASHGKAIEKAIQDDPYYLTPLKLHYLKWLLFDIGNEKFFMYQGIFDTDFDKFPDDAVALFNKLGLSTSFENLEGFPEDWKTRPEGFIKFVRDHHCPSFLEYGEYPYVTADEVKKALKLKKAFSEALDQMQ